MVKIVNLNLRRGNSLLAKDFCLTVDDGERIGITGPSGCGKSTLLKSILAGHVSESSDYEFFEISQKAKSYMPQSDGLLPWFTLEKNFQLFDRHDETKTIAKLFKIDESLNLFPHQLSGGEYQRSILARSILSHPSIFLADEPLTELDILNKWQLLSYWSNTISQQNASLILVSHDIETLLYLCDRVLILSDKPSILKKEIKLKVIQPRPIEYLISEDFKNSKSEMLDLITLKAHKN